jgi:hypothetical protein
MAHRAMRILLSKLVVRSSDLVRSACCFSSIGVPPGPIIGIDSCQMAKNLDFTNYRARLLRWTMLEVLGGCGWSDPRWTLPEAPLKQRWVAR